jgi:MptA/FolE2 family GTP cyclohydrolase
MNLNLEYDVQNNRPRFEVRLNSVGIKNINKIIRLKNNGKDELFYSTIDIFVDLASEQKGVHMSRFDETINEVIDENIWNKSMIIEDMARYIAEKARVKQKARRSEVKIEAKYPVETFTPVSEKATQKINTVIGMAVSTEKATRHLIGVEAKGMTVCPCAQEMMKEYAERVLKKEGFSGDQILRILELIPMVSHNQKGIGTLMVGTEKDVPADKLVDIVERSMSSKILDLLKRPDEFDIVRTAHMNPRFVEDVVREMFYNTIYEFDELADEDFLIARQENFESIHSYEVFAEKHGTVAEIKKELEIFGRDSAQNERTPNTTISEWFAGTC